MRRRANLFLAVAFTACAACEASRGAGPVELSLTPYAGRLVTIEAAAEGEKFPMLFDTGAGVTALTPETASAAGCSPFGRLVGWRMSGERVEFERCGSMDLSFSDAATRTEVYVFDLAAALPRDLPPLGGIVSLASFADRPFTLDLATGVLTLETDDSLKGRAKSARPGELRAVKGPGGDEITLLVAVEASPGPLWFLLDSANLGDVLLSKSAAAALGAAAGNDPAPVSLLLKGVPPVEVTARLADIIYDGALNEDVMRRFKITIDLRREQIWFEPN